MVLLLLRGQIPIEGKPSQTLNKLRNLSGGRIDDVVLTSIFLDMLPESHRDILVATGANDISKLAEAADGLTDQQGRQGNINAINNKAERSWQDAIEKLEKKIDEISKRLDNRSRSSSRKKKSNLCKYHEKFGDKARWCREFCTQYETFTKKKRIDPHLSHVEGGVSQSSRFYVRDTRSKMLFLIDTGADISLIPSNNKRGKKKLKRNHVTIF